jgi:diguanylate cyclase (GGDEF)-like protein
MEHDPRTLGQRPVSFSLVITASVVALLYAAADRLIEDVLKFNSAWGELVEIVVMAAVASAALWVGVLQPLHREASRQRAVTVTRQTELEEHSRRQAFESQFHRAMEMAATEDMAYQSVAKALRIAAGGFDAELLLADSSDAHLKQVLSVSEDGQAMCNVGAPHDCPAIRRSQTLRFASSDALDACPHLGNRARGACSATCVPVSMAGRSIGVLHTVGPHDRPLTAQQAEQLETIASHAGTRIGLLRVMFATSLQAATDPLTGLLNRRAFENRLHALFRRGTSFALAMGDLDRFKHLNDSHGHEAGDRALRLFSKVLSESLRTDDIVSRYGGEEFLIAFPNQTSRHAADALRRMQEGLAIALADGTVPTFTVSFGVTDSDQSRDLDELCRIADAALFRAKRAGRDRVQVDVEHPGVGTTEPDIVAEAVVRAVTS